MEGHLAVSPSLEWKTSEALNTRLRPFAPIFSSESAKQAIGNSLKKYNVQCEWKHTSSPFSITVSSNCVDVCDFKRALFDSFLSVDLEVPEGGKGITPEIAASFEQKCAKWRSETRNAFHIALSADNSKVTIRTHAGNMPVLEIWRNTVRHYLRGLLFQTNTLLQLDRGDAGTQAAATEGANAILAVSQLALTESPIAKLADEDLLEIFKRLPAYDRLRTSEVCKHWYSVSRLVWLEVTRLDLSSMPSKSIAAVVKQCPNLRDVYAVRKTFEPNKLHSLPRISLHLLTLHECRSQLLATDGNISDAFSAMFSSNLRGAAWEELSLHHLNINITFAKNRKPPTVEFPASFPAALKRLQIDGVKVSRKKGLAPFDLLTFMRGFEQLQQLECLILVASRPEIVVMSALSDPAFLTSIGSLSRLRELQLSHQSVVQLWQVLMRLSRLETLFIHFTEFQAAGDFDNVVTKHPSLRILVLTGYFQNVFEFPMRALYADAFSAEPLPQLHIFVGKLASAKILFPKFPFEAAKVYPISEPLPRFLDREDVKAIFQGVWIAGKIKETAQRVPNLHNYEWDVAKSFRKVDG